MVQEDCTFRDLYGHITHNSLEVQSSEKFLFLDVAKLPHGSGLLCHDKQKPIAQPHQWHVNPTNGVLCHSRCVLKKINRHLQQLATLLICFIVKINRLRSRQIATLKLVTNMTTCNIYMYNKKMVHEEHSKNALKCCTKNQKDAF